jgi:hypothetical protein
MIGFSLSFLVPTNPIPFTVFPVGRLLHLLQILDVTNVVVIVSRWYGGKVRIISYETQPMMRLLS